MTFDRDECIRPETTVEKLAALQPIKGVVSFGDKEIVITAGNSCPTNDGVSAALLMSEEKARALGLEPLARIVGIGVGGVKPQLMGIGPIVSTKKALEARRASAPSRSTASSSTRPSPRRCCLRCASSASRWSAST